MQLAPAGDDAIDVAMPLVRQFYAHFGYPFDETQKRAVLEAFVRDPSLGRMLLVLRDGSLSGYVLLAFMFSLEFNGPVAFIDELYIAPSGRQKGLGSAVLGQVEELCAGLGMKALRLESEADNPRATALYSRSGYRLHERHIMTKVIARG